jgi:GTPase SAR1 family protein
MGNRASKTEMKPGIGFESSLVDGELKLTPAESTNRVTKIHYDAFIDKDQIRRIMDRSSDDCDLCRILVLGKSRVGKSALINALVGGEMVQESHGRYGNRGGLEVFKLNVSGKAILLMESPGLFDGCEREEGHIQEMKSTFKSTSSSKLDLVLFCYPVTSSSSTIYDKYTLELFTSALGYTIWSRAIIILTFANNVVTATVDDLVSSASSQIKALLISQGIDQDVVDAIPVGIAGHKDDDTVGGNGDWLWILWRQIMDRSSDRVKPILNKFENERFVPYGFLSVDVIPSDIDDT